MSRKKLKNKMAKKITVTLNFNETQLFLNPASAEKTALVDTFFSKPLIVKIWTEEEKLFGKTRETSHLDNITLNLMLKSSDNPKNTLSSWSSLVVGYDNLLQYEDVSISYLENSIIINGEIKLRLSVKDVIYPDLVQFSDRLYFDNLSFVVENSGDILEFNKYGLHWELAATEKKEYFQESNEAFVQQRPKITVSTK